MAGVLEENARLRRQVSDLTDRLERLERLPESNNSDSESADVNEVRLLLDNLRSASSYKPEFTELQTKLLSLRMSRHVEAKSLWDDYVAACSDRQSVYPDFFLTGTSDDDFFEVPVSTSPDQTTVDNEVRPSS